MDYEDGDYVAIVFGDQEREMSVVEVTGVEVGF